MRLVRQWDARRKLYLQCLRREIEQDGNRRCSCVGKIRFASTSVGNRNNLGRWQIPAWSPSDSRHVDATVDAGGHSSMMKYLSTKYRGAVAHHSSISMHQSMPALRSFVFHLAKVAPRFGNRMPMSPCVIDICGDVPNQTKCSAPTMHYINILATSMFSFRNSELSDWKLAEFNLLYLPCSIVKINT